MSPAAVLPASPFVLRWASRLALVIRTASLVLLALGGVTTTARAQVAPAVIAVADTVKQIRLTDGSVFYGRIVAVDGDLVTIQLESGTRIEVTRPQIYSVQRTASRLVRGERWEADPNATRLFFGPTGRALGRGTGYFAVYELLMPFLSYGITDRISISGGTPIVPAAMGELLYLAPKVTVISRPGVDFAAGAIAFFLPGEDESLGLAYGVGTFGTSDNAFTAGVGVPFIAGEEDDIADRVVIMFGAEARASRRTKFIGESYFVPGEAGGVLALGVRFFGERLSADAGLGFLLGDDAGCCLPIVNFVYVFGEQR